MSLRGGGIHSPPEENHRALRANEDVLKPLAGRVFPSVVGDVPGIAPGYRPKAVAMNLEVVYDYRLARIPGIKPGRASR